MVPSDGNNLDISLTQSFQTALNGANGFVEAVLLIDKVPADDHEIDFFFYRQRDNRLPCTNPGEFAAIVV
jgi:hypothetical protein